MILFEIDFIGSIINKSVFNVTEIGLGCKMFWALVLSVTLLLMWNYSLLKSKNVCKMFLSKILD